MKDVASYRFLLSAVKMGRSMACLLVLLGCAPLVQAQETNDTLPAIEAPIVEDASEEVAEEKIPVNVPLELRQVPESTVRNLKQDKDFAYANDPDYWADEQKAKQQARAKKIQEEQQEIENEQKEDRKYKKSFWDSFDGFFSGNTVKGITYSLLILFFLFVFYRIVVVNKLYLFDSFKKSKVAAEGEEADIADDNLDEKIRKAIVAGEHRVAVRYMYLKSLRLLNDRQLIRYHSDGTNYEYVNQLSKHKLGNDFSFLTRIYDYVWYGEFTITAEQFDIVNKNFSHFYNALNS